MITQRPGFRNPAEKSITTFSLFNASKRVARSARLETESITTIFGDVKLDLTQTALARGDHRMRILTLFSAVEVETLSCHTEEKPGGSWISENFDQAPVRVYLSIQGLFGDIKVLRLPTADTPALAQPIDTAALVTERLPGYMGQTSKLGRDER